MPAYYRDVVRSLHQEAPGGVKDMVLTSPRVQHWAVWPLVAQISAKSSALVGVSETRGRWEVSIRPYSSVSWKLVKRETYQWRKSDQ